MSDLATSSDDQMPLGVRKGAWSEEEDKLLRKCIQIYGEGRWHLVPIRAGLNRCRKSCRLRWLNYLKPNIKRGEFKEDEVDLIMRLHKLLGNRWSLIAGRLPGRTANDVKNYWNTHLRRKATSCKEQDRKSTNCEEELRGIKQQITKTNIIRPRPRTFSKNFIKRSSATAKPWMQKDCEILSKGNVCNPCMVTLTMASVDLDNESTWWERLLNDDVEINEANTGGPLHGLSAEVPIINSHPEQENMVWAKVGDTCIEQGLSCESEFAFDLDILSVLDAKQDTTT